MGADAFFGPLVKKDKRQQLAFWFAAQAYKSGRAAAHMMERGTGGCFAAAELFKAALAFWEVTDRRAGEVPEGGGAAACEAGQAMRLLAAFYGQKGRGHHKQEAAAWQLLAQFYRVQQQLERVKQGTENRSGWSLEEGWEVNRRRLWEEGRADQDDRKRSVVQEEQEVRKRRKEGDRGGEVGKMMIYHIGEGAMERNGADHSARSQETKKSGMGEGKDLMGGWQGSRTERDLSNCKAPEFSPVNQSGGGSEVTGTESGSIVTTEVLPQLSQPGDPPEVASAPPDPPPWGTSSSSAPLLHFCASFLHVRLHLSPQPARAPSCRFPANSGGLENSAIPVFIR